MNKLLASPYLSQSLALITSFIILEFRLRPLVAAIFLLLLSPILTVVLGFSRVTPGFELN